MEIQKNVSWHALIYTTVSPIGAAELKAVNLHEITYLSQMQSTACTEKLKLMGTHGRRNYLKSCAEDDDW